MGKKRGIPKTSPEWQAELDARTREGYEYMARRQQVTRELERAARERAEKRRRRWERVRSLLR